MKKRIIAVLLSMVIALGTGAVCNTTTVQAATTTAAAKSSAFATVRRGSTGSDVEQLQCILNYLSKNYKKPAWHSGKIDGKFGPATESAVKAFQKNNKLTPDGICGPKTWDKLFSLVS